MITGYGNCRFYGSGVVKYVNTSSSSGSGSGSGTTPLTGSLAPDLYQYLCLSSDVSNNVLYNYAKSTWDLGMWGPVSTLVSSSNAGHLGAGYTAYTTPKNLVITTEKTFPSGCLYYYTTPSDTSTETWQGGTNYANGCVAYATTPVTLPSLATGFTFSCWWNNKNMIAGRNPSNIFVLTAGQTNQQVTGGYYLEVTLFPTSSTGTTIIIVYNNVSGYGRKDIDVSTAISKPNDGIWHFIAVKFYTTHIDLLIDNTWFRNTIADSACIPQNRSLYLASGFNYGDWASTFSWAYVSNLCGWGKTLSDAEMTQVYATYAANNNLIPEVSTFAGTYGSIGYTGDGGLATSALIGRPTNMAYDPAGYLYFTEYNSNVIRKINMSTNIISTVLGNGTSSANTGNGLLAVNAKCASPFGILLDASKNILFLDNGTSLRKIDAATGIVSLVKTVSYSYGMCYDINGNILLGGANGSGYFYRFNKDTNGLISGSSTITTYSTTAVSSSDVYNTFIYCDPSGNIWCGQANSNALGCFSSTGSLLFKFSTTGPFSNAYPTALKPSSGAVFIKPNGNMLLAIYGVGTGSRIYENSPGADGQFGFGSSSSSTGFTTKLVINNTSAGSPRLVTPMSGNYQFLPVGNDLYLTQDQNGHVITKISNYNALT